MSPLWNPELYQQKHSFVWQLSADLIELLNPQVGEQVLDLGCGTGQLTQAIAERGAAVIGIDADAKMIQEAQQNFPALAFAVGDARTLSLPYSCDAVFSNAALHWIPEADAVAQSIWKALKPGGRFVAEFGGKGNVATIVEAIAAARHNLGLGTAATFDWYFPAVGEYSSLLESQGFEVQYATLFDRPTPLATDSGLRNWLQMFAHRFWADLSSEQQQTFLSEVEMRTRSKLYRDGQWWADYRRIRILAVRPT
ncbi:MAG: methyltransferase domain-containing protein [Cyanobacteria bacterium P01_H01_bin.58]